MEKLTKKQLLAGLGHKDQRVYEAYFDFIVRDWLSSKDGGYFGEFLSWFKNPELTAVISRNFLLEQSGKSLIRQVRTTPKLDFDKVEKVLKNGGKVGVSNWIQRDLAISVLFNLDKFSNKCRKSKQEKELINRIKDFLGDKITIAHCLNIISIEDRVPLPLLEVVGRLDLNVRPELCFNFIKSLLVQATMNPPLRKTAVGIALKLIETREYIKMSNFEDFNCFVKKFPEYQKKAETAYLKAFDSFRPSDVSGRETKMVMMSVFSSKLKIKYMLVLGDLYTDYSMAFECLSGIDDYAAKPEAGKAVLYVAQKLLKRYPSSCFEISEKIKELSRKLNSVYDVTPWEHIKQTSSEWQKTVFWALSLAAKGNFNPAFRVQNYFILLYMWSENHEICEGCFSQLLMDILKKKWICNSGCYGSFRTLLDAFEKFPSETKNSISTLVCEGVRKVLCSAGKLDDEIFFRFKQMAKDWQWKLTEELEIHCQYLAEFDLKCQKELELKEQNKVEAERLLALIG